MMAILEESRSCSLFVRSLHSRLHLDKRYQSLQWPPIAPYEDHNQVEPKPLKLNVAAGMARDKQGFPIPRVSIFLFTEVSFRYWWSRSLAAALKLLQTPFCPEVAERGLPEVRSILRGCRLPIHRAGSLQRLQL
jgi:hypothetical protein